MNLEAFKTAMQSKAASHIFALKRNSPTILFAAGAVGVVGTVVLACRATLKMSDRLTDAELSRQVVTAKRDRNEIDDETLAQVNNKIKFDLATDIVKMYALPIGVGVASLASLGGAHYILHKRNGIILASYAALHKAHSEYRKRVSDEVGAEKEREIYLGVQEREVVEKLSDGKEKVTLQKFIPEGRADGLSPYAKLFDQQSSKFTKEPGMNEVLLSIKMAQANDKLKINGHITLNEVYDLLGFERTQAGFIVGWLYDPQNLRQDGVDRDNFVSFGMFSGDVERTEAFLDGYEDVIWLDFNVDGPIYDKVGTRS